MPNLQVLVYYVYVTLVPTLLGSKTKILFAYFSVYTTFYLYLFY